MAAASDAVVAVAETGNKPVFKKPFRSNTEWFLFLSKTNKHARVSTNKSEIKMETEKFMPPEPVWECHSCGHKLYEKSATHPDGLPSHEPGPAKCPKCGSTNVSNMHLVIMKDPA